MSHLSRRVCGRIRWPLLIFSGICITCYGCATDQSCFNRPILPSFIGFASNETDTFIVRRYKANDSFNVLIDTFKISRPYSGYQSSNDTTSVNIQAGVVNGPLLTGQIQTGYDWEIYLPVDNRTIFISGILSESRSTKCDRGFILADLRPVCNCGNPILSLSMDSLKYAYPDTTTIYRIYIHK